MFDGLPKVGLALLVIIALLLLFALRSVFLPVKAVVLVVMSLGASLGSLLLLVTTKVGATLIGASGPQDIHPIVPITIVAITVALSTDYEVILISRIAEHYRRTGDNRGAVVSGIEHTGSVITSAATIMIAVFAGFALTDLLPVKQLGVGLGLAVLLDATVVRGVLVPATMAMMGRGNWWWPARRPARVADVVPAEAVPVPAALPQVPAALVQVPAALPEVPVLVEAVPGGRGDWWAPEQLAALARRRAAFAQEIITTAQERGVRLRDEQHAVSAHAAADAGAAVVTVMDQASWRRPGRPAAGQPGSDAPTREYSVGRIHYAADVKQTIIMERIRQEPAG
jgi:hypothetical protein